MRRTGVVFAGLLLAGSFAAGEAQAQAQNANAQLVNSDGEEIGNVSLDQLEQGVRIYARAEGLPSGTHGFHIHETGTCEPPDFQSAGGHYAPRGNAHGWDYPDGPHAGDLPNVHIQDDGVLATEFFTDTVTLGEGEATVFDDDGSAIMIHSGADDYESQPSGDAGSRIACGVIEAAQ